MPPPQDPVLTSAAYLMIKAGHYLGQGFESALAALGISAREFLVLTFVRAADGLSQQELSARLGLDPTIVVGLVDGLEERDLMSRRRDPADRRRNVLSVTSAGEDLQADAVAAAARAEAEFLAPLDADQRQELRRMMLVLMQPRLPWLE
ncbi:MAG: MarR family winged helix-turn-helix transcriptional regulator [Ilumatobacteraceae bacterium]